MDFKLDERYALLSQLIMNCMFYAAIFPIGILITIIGMGITFWSSKWWIVRYCSLTKFSYRLGRHIVRIWVIIEYYLMYFSNNIRIRLRSQYLHDKKISRVRSNIFHLYRYSNNPNNPSFHNIR